MDTIWPSGIVPSSQTWRVIGNAGVFSSPLSGATRTVSRTGARMGCTVTVPPLRGQDRARFMAFIAALRDKSNRAYIPDFSTTLRGSFPATELLTNGDASSTTGWTAENSSLSSSDNVIRIKNTKAMGAADFAAYQSGMTVTQYAPYAVRGFISAVSRAGMSNGSNLNSVSNYATDRAGMVTQASVFSSASSGSVYPALFDSGGNISFAGDYGEISYASLARCVLADAGPNALTYSDDITNAAWTKSGCTIGSGGTAPDGTATANYIIENSATSAHYCFHSTFAVPSAAADICFCIALKGGGRNFGYIQIVESTGSTVVSQFFNLGTGAVGASSSVGANWSNLRAFTPKNLGNGWYLCCIVARKTNAATSLFVQVGSGSADGTSSYLGDGASGIYLWRATSAQSSVPVRITQTTSAAAASGTVQTGSGIYVKGLPVSTNGLLKAGDMVQLGNQINIVTASLDSDAAGLGYLQCGNPWNSSVADNDPIIVKNPMSKMILASEDMSIETGPGQFSPFQLEFVEDVT